MDKFNFQRGFTHNGYFHADDVFSSAFLRLLNPNIAIFRVAIAPSKELLTDTDIVFDIGDGEFDHHLGDKKVRADGTPYSSIGLLWNKFASLLYSDFVIEYVDSNLIKEIDLADNFGEYSGLSNLIYFMNDRWFFSEYGDSQESAFQVAVDIAYVVLTNFIRKAQLKESITLDYYAEHLSPEFSTDTIKSYSVPLPYPNIQVDKKIQFLIFLSSRNDWVCYPMYNDFYFPKELRGVRNEVNLELPYFVDKLGKVAVFKDLESAYKFISAYEKDCEGLKCS